MHCKVWYVLKHKTTQHSRKPSSQSREHENTYLEILVEISVLDHEVAGHYGQREIHLSRGKEYLSILHEQFCTSLEIVIVNNNINTTLK